MKCKFDSCSKYFLPPVNCMFPLCIGFASVSLENMTECFTPKWIINFYDSIIMHQNDYICSFTAILKHQFIFTIKRLIFYPELNIFLSLKGYFLDALTSLEANVSDFDFQQKFVQ